jgi:hypothetical protein
MVMFPGTAFAQELVNNILRRQLELFENDIMLAAMYLDPRF